MHKTAQDWYTVLWKNVKLYKLCFESVQLFSMINLELLLILYIFASCFCTVFKLRVKNGCVQLCVLYSFTYHCVQIFFLEFLLSRHDLHVKSFILLFAGNGNIIWYALSDFLFFLFLEEIYCWNGYSKNSL